PRERQRRVDPEQRRLVFVVEVLEEVARDLRAELAVHAVRELQRAVDHLEVRLILAAALPVDDATQDLRLALVAVVAGDAAAAGLLLHEGGEHLREHERVRLVVAKDEAAAAHDRVPRLERRALEDQRRQRLRRTEATE